MRYGEFDFQLAPIQTCGERINQLRRQIIVHSYIYYKMGQNLITDTEFDDRAYELVDLQQRYPAVSLSVPYELSAFMDFDASTGFDLPYDNQRVANLAKHLFRMPL